MRTEGLAQLTSQQLPAGARWLQMVQRPEFTKRRWVTDDPFSGAAVDVVMHSDSQEHSIHDLGAIDPADQTDGDSSLEVARKLPR